MRKICTDCKWYPKAKKSFFQRLFGLKNTKPVYNEFAKCQHPDTVRLDGKKQYCELLRREWMVQEPCGFEGTLFEPWEEQ